MKYQKEAALINELITLSEVIPMPSPNDRRPLKSFGLGEYNITFIGFDKVTKYQESIEKLFMSNKEISETYSFTKFEEQIINLIRIIKKQGQIYNPSDFESLISGLLSIEVKDYELLYDFYGATMKSAINEFGDFVIYNRELSDDNLIAKYPALQNREIFFKNLHSNLLIGVKVKARESSKATEIADKLCQSFENVFSYAIADLSHNRRVGILNFRGWTSISRIVCNNDTMGFQGSNDIFLQLNLDDPFFKDSSQGNDKIWHLITKKNKNEIEERLLNAIEWIGKAINDRDVPKSLVQFVFAIEGMLQLNDKAFITPSIVSQLSDWLAFIIQDYKEERKKIAKYFKDIYQKRSAIAHGANKTINIEDLELAKQIAKIMVISFLVTSPFKEMKTMDELNKHLTDLKFK
jgi:hypothetical protein